MKDFHLIIWKEFDDKRLVDRQEIIRTDNITTGMDNLKTMNAQKRLTTAEYRTVNLSELLKKHSLKIVEDIIVENN